MNYHTKKKNKAFSLIIRLMNLDQINTFFEKQDEQIGPHKKTIRRWILCETIPQDGDYSYSYESNGFKALIDLLSETKYSDWEGLIRVFFDQKNITFDLKKYKDNFEEIQLKFPEYSFDSISKWSDTSLHYYRTSGKSFFDFFISVLENQWDDAKSNIFRKKLLSTKITDSAYTFPAVQLLEDGINFKLNNNLEYSHDNPAPIEYIAQLKKIRTAITDNPTFTLAHLNLDDGLMNCGTSTYYKAMFDCDQYWYQMVVDYKDNWNKSDVVRVNEKHYIKRWKIQIDSTVFNNDYTNIEASLGGCCLLVMKSLEGPYYYPLISKVPEANGSKLMHVVPSFMFQPLTRNKLLQDAELDYSQQVFKELLEEVFGAPETKAHTTNKEAYRVINEDPRINGLKSMLKKGTAHFYTTGLWLDMYRLRPEMTSVLIVHDHTWYESYCRKPTMGSWENEEGGINLFNLEDTEKYHNILLQEYAHMAPPGLAALIKGRERALSVIKDMS